MPRQEIYEAINNPGRLFMSRAEYLDYLRVRRRERQSWARLCAGREAALQRLYGVRGCQDWQEVEDFLNDHSRDIDLVAAREYPICDIKIRVKGEGMESACWRRAPFAIRVPRDKEADEPTGTFPAWTGRFQHNYRRDETTQRRQMKSEDWTQRALYDLPYRAHQLSGHTDVFDEIGIHSKGGGGSGPYAYDMVIFQQDFDHLRVMERLAA